MTVLQAISLLAPVMGAEITSEKLLPVVITSSKDRSEFTLSLCGLKLVQFTFANEPLSPVQPQQIPSCVVRA
jgi:hypothetical protein